MRASLPPLRPLRGYQTLLMQSSRRLGALIEAPPFDASMCRGVTWGSGIVNWCASAGEVMVELICPLYLRRHLLTLESHPRPRTNYNLLGDGSLEQAENLLQLS